MLAAFSVQEVAGVETEQERVSTGRAHPARRPLHFDCEEAPLHFDCEEEEKERFGGGEKLAREGERENIKNKRAREVPL